MEKLLNIGPSYFGRPSMGISKESKEAEKISIELIGQDEPSLTVLNLLSLFHLLDEIYQEASIAGWDGYEAEPIGKDALFKAKQLLACLPPITIVPKIIPDQSGEIAFKWEKNKNVLIVSVSNQSELTYACLIEDSEKYHGSLPFDNEVPSTILEYLEKYF